MATDKQKELLKNYEHNYHKMLAEIMDKYSQNPSNSTKHLTSMSALIDDLLSAQKKVDAEIVEQGYFSGCVLPSNYTKEWSDWAHELYKERLENKKGLQEKILNQK